MDGEDQGGSATAAAAAVLTFGIIDMIILPTPSTLFL